VLFAASSLLALGLLHGTTLYPSLTAVLDSCPGVECVFGCVTSPDPAADSWSDAKLETLTKQIARFPTFSLERHRPLLVHYELLRLYRSMPNRVPFTEDGLPPQSRAENDIAILVAGVYLRSLPPPAYREAVQKGLIVTRTVQSKEVGAVLKLLLVSEAMEAGVGFGVAGDGDITERELRLQVVHEIERDYPDYVYGQLAEVVATLEPFYARSLLRTPVCADRSGQTAESALLRAESKLIAILDLVAGVEPLLSTSPSLSNAQAEPVRAEIEVQDRVASWLDSEIAVEQPLGEEMVSVINNYLEALIWMEVVKSETDAAFSDSGGLARIRDAIPRLAGRLVAQETERILTHVTDSVSTPPPVRLAVTMAEWSCVCSTPRMSPQMAEREDWISYVATALDWIARTEDDRYWVEKWREYLLRASPHLAGRLSAQRLDAMFEKIRIDQNRDSTHKEL
jgi:hypothetical protein